MHRDDSIGLVDEAALTELGAGFAALFEQSHVPMYVLSVDGRFLAVNRAYADLVELSVEALVEEDPLVTHPDDQPERLRLEARLLASAEGGSGPFSFRHERRLLPARAGRVGGCSVTLIRDGQACRWGSSRRSSISVPSRDAAAGLRRPPSACRC